ALRCPPRLPSLASFHAAHPLLAVALVVHHLDSPALREEIQGQPRHEPKLRAVGERRDPPAPIDALHDPLCLGAPGECGHRPYGKRQQGKSCPPAPLPTTHLRLLPASSRGPPTGGLHGVLPLPGRLLSNSSSPCLALSLPTSVSYPDCTMIRLNWAR